MKSFQRISRREIQEYIKGWFVRNEKKEKVSYYEFHFPAAVDP